MATWRVNNSTVLGGRVCAPWAPSTAYSFGARVVCRTTYSATARPYVYECTIAGISGSSEPTWPTTVGGTVIDGSCVWTCRSPSDGSWDNATCFIGYLFGSSGPMAAGDTVLVHYEHSETGFATSLYAPNSGTPVRIVSVDKGSSDSPRQGAYLGYTGSSRFYFYRGSFYVWGCTLEGFAQVGTGTNAVRAELESCTIKLNPVTFSLNSARFTAINCVFEITAAVTYGISANNGSIVELLGGSFGTARTDTLYFLRGLTASQIRADCLDMSARNPGPSNYQYDLSILQGAQGCLSRCLLSSNERALLCATPDRTALVPSRMRSHHSTAAAPAQKNTLKEVTTAGTCSLVFDDVYLAGTAARTPENKYACLKMEASAYATVYGYGLESPPICGWCATTNERLFIVECLIDSATLPTKNDLRLMIELPGSTTSGLGQAVWSSELSMTPEDVEESPAAEWEGTGGMSNARPIRLSVTATPAMPGPYTARVYLHKASATVYVDPMVVDYAP